MAQGQQILHQTAGNEQTQSPHSLSVSISDIRRGTNSKDSTLHLLNLQLKKEFFNPMMGATLMLEKRTGLVTDATLSNFAQIESLTN